LDLKRSLQLSGDNDSRLEKLIFQIETSFDKLEDIRNEWDTFLLNVGGDIYLTYDWCKLWWDYYGKGCKLQVFLFRFDTKLVGIIPLFIDTVWLGPVRLRIARIIGSQLPPKISDIPVHEDWVKEIFDKTLTHLVGEDYCDIICFGPLSGTYYHMERLREVCLNWSDLIKVNIDEKRGPHTIFELPDNYDAYLTSLSKKERSKSKYELRLLQRTFNVNLDIVTNEVEIDKEFVEFCRLHDQQWQSQGFRGHFGAWPKAPTFISFDCKWSCCRLSIYL
jgi:hypothetical protein